MWEKTIAYRHNCEFQQHWKRIFFSLNTSSFKFSDKTYYLASWLIHWYSHLDLIRFQVSLDSSPYLYFWYLCTLSKSDQAAASSSKIPTREWRMLSMRSIRWEVTGRLYSPKLVCLLQSHIHKLPIYVVLW